MRQTYYICHYNFMIHIEIAAEKLFSLWGMPITNTLINGIIVSGMLIIGAVLFSKKISSVPSLLQNIFEIIIESLLDAMEGIFGSRARAEKYLPLIATIFIFVLLSNWFGIIPGVGSIGVREIKEDVPTFVPLFRSAASDLNFTLTLAIIAVLFVNVSGITTIGFFKHFSKFFSFKNPIAFFVGILEFISEIAKMVSFSFRLFGNVFAGEVLLITIGFLAPYIVPVPFLGLEIFVGFIQALVFSMLTMVFISIATSHH